ncbi:MAG: prephenate dehydrogenase/arogenate dehydrogenase family protein [Anaerolineae bacterium]|nr:prephenate dehydrogenase/arogenate dehydrogenase family protein [Anaerolineae bacterium]
MGKITVTVIGLGRMGASVGLALKRYNGRSDARHEFDVIGVDDRPSLAHDAEKMGAVHKLSRNLYDAVRDRDIIVLAQPYAEVRRTYQNIGQDVRAGCVIMDFSPLKQPSVHWASEYLPDEVHMVGMTPVVNPAYLYDGLDETNFAHADFFDNGTMMLMPSPSCIREAVELASDFATLLGMKPHFMDIAEHDSLVGATESLPGVLGAVAFYMLSQNAGWGDIQRLTNPAFGQLTHHLFDTHPDDLRDQWLSNRDSLLHYVGGMIQTLESFQSALATNDRAALEALLSTSSESYSTWVNRRHNNKWDDHEDPTQVPSTGQTIMSTLMGGFLANRISGKDSKNNGTA